jgi:hypothetical protein
MPDRLDSPLVLVRCPECGAGFVINVEEETATNAPPDGWAEPGAVMAFRPVCPACRQRVGVRVSRPAAREPRPDRDS